MTLEPLVSQTKRLTTRQFECARLAAKGRTSKEIARELGISPSTVDNHIVAAMAAVNLDRRSDFKDYFQKFDNLRNNLNSSPDSDLKFLNYTQKYDGIKDNIEADRPTMLENNIKKLYIYSFLFLSGLLIWISMIIVIIIIIMRIMR